MPIWRFVYAIKSLYIVNIQKFYSLKSFIGTEKIMPAAQHDWWDLGLPPFRIFIFRFYKTWAICCKNLSAAFSQANCTIA